MPQLLEALIIFLVAIALFRLEGKETISMMRPGQVVVMIGIASILVEPLKSKSLWGAIYSGALLITMSLILTYVHIFFPKIGRWIVGEPIVLIKNGEILEKNLKRARMTVDDLKMRMRTEKISEITMIRLATLETSGKLGIELFPQNVYATKKDMEDLKEAIHLIGSKLNVITTSYSPPKDPKNNLFIQAENKQEQDPLQ